MRVPFDWLKEFVELFESPEQVAQELSALGYPVEGLGAVGGAVRNVLVGTVRSIEAHPKADLMKVCQVDLGDEGEAQIVTTAANVRVGQNVAAAIHGAVLASGERIKRGKLRGVSSEGMLCSAFELGLSQMDLPQEQRQGLIEMPEHSEPGTDVLDLLGLDQQVLHINPWPGRNPGGLLGLARELAVRLDRSLDSPSLSIPDIVESEFFRPSEHLSEVALLALGSCKMEPSPAWMSRRLRAAGVHSVFNVLDILRYVMVETGQPLHVYDLDRLEPPLELRRSLAGEKLNGVALIADAWVVADRRGPVAVAGVAVGADFQVRPKTRKILVKGALYRPGLVAENVARLGLTSESSRRFAAGPKPSHLNLALRRADWLLGRLARGKPLGRQHWRAPIEEEAALELERLERHLGPIEPIWVEQALVAAGLPFHRVGGRIAVPGVAEGHVLEELLRLRGLDHLEAVPPLLKAAPSDDLDVRRPLAMLGFSELVTSGAGEPWEALLEVARRHKEPLQLMEQTDGDLTLLVSGREGAYLHLKGFLESLAELAQAELDFEPGGPSWLHPGRSARVGLGSAALGWVGELHPDAEHDGTALASLSLERLSARARPRGLVDPERQRWIERDVAVVLAESVWASKVTELARRAAGPLLLSVTCFDVYRGSQIPEGEKSLALRLRFGSERETEVSAAVTRVLSQLREQLGARQRA